MSKRIDSHFKTSTSQIINMVEDNELSFHELFWNLGTDERVLSKDVSNLVTDGVIARKFHNNNVVYTRVHDTPAVRILHRIERLIR
jgi:DNA-binding HxlR family transcriptional regulator